MPNHVKNRITFIGEGKNVQEVLDLIKGEDSPLDFNRLIPMPDSLNLVSGGQERESISLFADAFINAPEKLNFLAIPTSKQVEIATYIHNKYDSLFKTSHDISETINYFVKEYNEYQETKENQFSYSVFSDATIMLNMFDKHKNNLEKFVLELGYTYVNNYIEYGATTWYEWCNLNWGTKWNAYNDEKVGNKISFTTAWSFPQPVMEKLAQLCAKYNVEISALYADEDTGSNTGFFESIIDNGECLTELTCYDIWSHEAFKTYIDLWGDSPCIGIDKNGLYYKKDCDTCNGC
jgi:hypothetical protein